MNVKFDKVATALTQAKIPCRLKETSIELIIECGMWYPDELVDKIYEAIPDFKGSICAEHSGNTIIASTNICGGPKRY
jgi:hypothetical protein